MQPPRTVVWGAICLVISMDHNHHSNRPCGETPAVLPGKLLLSALLCPAAVCAVRVCLELDIKHFGEVLAQAVAGASLQSTIFHMARQVWCQTIISEIKGSLERSEHLCYSNLTASYATFTVDELPDTCRIHAAYIWTHALVLMEGPAAAPVKPRF